MRGEARKETSCDSQQEPSVDLRALLMDPFPHLILSLFACHAMLALISCKNCDCLSPFHHTSALQLQFTCIAFHPSKGKVPRKEQARLRVNWSGCTENQKNQLQCPGVAGKISFERSCQGFTQCHCVTGAGLMSKVLKKPFCSGCTEARIWPPGQSSFLGQTAVSHPNRMFSTEVHCLFLFGTS